MRDQRIMQKLVKIQQFTGYSCDCNSLTDRYIAYTCTLISRLNMALKSKQVNLNFLHLGRLTSGLLSHIIRNFLDEFVTYIVSKLAPYSMSPPKISTTIDEINIYHKIPFPGPHGKGCCEQSSLFLSANCSGKAITFSNLTVMG